MVKYVKNWAMARGKCLKWSTAAWRMHAVKNPKYIKNVQRSKNPQFYTNFVFKRKFYFQTTVHCVPNIWVRAPKLLRHSKEQECRRQTSVRTSSCCLNKEHRSGRPVQTAVQQTVPLSIGSTSCLLDSGLEKNDALAMFRPGMRLLFPVNLTSDCGGYEVNFQNFNTEKCAWRVVLLFFATFLKFRTLLKRLTRVKVCKVSITEM